MKYLFTFLAAILSSALLHGQMSFTGAPIRVGFDYAKGNGFVTAPKLGQLSSTEWSFTGLSTAYTPGGNNTTGSYARGLTINGTAATEGVYVYDESTNQFLIFQPTAAAFNPGSVALNLVNNSGATLTTLSISYDVKEFNNGNYSTTFNFSYDEDGAGAAAPVAVPALNFASTLAAAATPTVLTFVRSTVLAGLNIPNGTSFQLIWNSADAGPGTGVRDEIGIDNIVISSAAFPAAMTGFSLGTSSLNENVATHQVGVTMSTAPSAPVTLRVSVDTTGTAYAGADYTFNGQNLTFNTFGVYPQTQNVSIGIVNDLVSESNETIPLRLSLVSGFADITQVRHTVAIIDNEPQRGLIINEFSQGPAGVQEYLELLVIGPAGTTVDLRNWIVDDNNGLFNNGGFQFGGTGIAPGHLKFSNDCGWEDVPAGSIILLYNADAGNVNGQVQTLYGNPVVDDPTDRNADYLYIIGVANNNNISTCAGAGATDSLYLATGCLRPESPNLGGGVLGTEKYSPTSYDYVNWSRIGGNNNVDAYQTRRPDRSFFHGFSYTGNPGMSGVAHPDVFSPAVGGNPLHFSFIGATLYRVYSMTNNSNADYRRGVNWTPYLTADASTQTPGQSNNAANNTWIQSLRSPLPVTDVNATRTCRLGANEARYFFNPSSNPREIITWLRNNTGFNHGATTAATVYNPGNEFRNNNISGTPFFSRKQVTLSAVSVNGSSNSFTIRLYLSPAELAALTNFVNAQTGSSFSVNDILSMIQVYQVPSPSLPSNSNGTGVNILTPSVSTYGSDYCFEATFSNVPFNTSFGLGVSATVLEAPALSLRGEALPEGTVSLRWTMEFPSSVREQEIWRQHAGVWESIALMGGADSPEGRRTETPLPGENLYQLRVLYADGRSSESNIWQYIAPGPQSLALLSVAPQPASGRLQLRVMSPAAGEARWRLMTADGRSVWQRQLFLQAGAQTIELDLPPLPAGVYFQRLDLQQYSTTARLLLK